MYSQHFAFQQHAPHSQAPKQIQPLPGIPKAITNMVQIILPLQTQLQPAAVKSQYVIQSLEQPQVLQELDSCQIFLQKSLAQHQPACIQQRSAVQPQWQPSSSLALVFWLSKT